MSVNIIVSLSTLFGNSEFFFKHTILVNMIAYLDLKLSLELLSIFYLNVKYLVSLFQLLNLAV
jgi:hypothetical protein